MGELIIGGVVFFILTAVAIKIIEFLLKVAGKIVANLVATFLLIGGVVFGLVLFAGGEASAAVAIAVPASMAVTKMRAATTGGF